MCVYIYVYVYIHQKLIQNTKGFVIRLLWRVPEKFVKFLPCRERERERERERDYLGWLSKKII